MSHSDDGLAFEEACRTMLDQLPVMVRLWTPSRGVTFVNRAWCEATGSQLDANVGDGWLAFVPAEDRASLTTPMATGTTSYRLVRADGTTAHVLDTSTPWSGANGTADGVLHTLTIQSSSPASTTMSSWAHELRGPLNAILGWSDLLSAGDASPDILERGLKAIAANARQQALIIKRMTE